MIEIQRCADAEQWDEYVLEHGGHPLQLWGWGQVKGGHGWFPERVFAIDPDQDDKVVGAAQVLIRKLPVPFRSLAYVPRGPIVEDGFQNDFLEAIATLARRDHGSVAISIEPNAMTFEKPDGWVKSTNRILSPETILLDITKPESELLADMAKKTRQYIRKSAAEGIEIKQVRSREALKKCMEIYHQTADRAKFNLHADQYYYDVYNQMNDFSPVFAAYQNGVPVAFLWMAISETTAYELYGGMNEEGQRLRANYALKWHVILKMKEWGLSQYDFGGLVVGGVSIFKQGWAKQETTFAGTYDKPLSPLYGVWTKGLPKAKAVLQRLRR